MPELPEILETAIVAPDDTLVIVFPADITMAQAGRFKEMLDDSHLAGRVLMVAGIEQLAVLKGDAK